MMQTHHPPLRIHHDELIVDSFAGGGGASCGIEMALGRSPDIAIARGYVAPQGIDLICVPAFVDIDIEGQERTAIKFFVEPLRQ